MIEGRRNPLIGVMAIRTFRLIVLRELRAVNILVAPLAILCRSLEYRSARAKWNDMA